MPMSRQSDHSSLNIDHWHATCCTLVPRSDLDASRPAHRLPANRRVAEPSPRSARTIQRGKDAARGRLIRQLARDSHWRRRPGWPARSGKCSTDIDSYTDGCDGIDRCTQGVEPVVAGHPATDHATATTASRNADRRNPTERCSVERFATATGSPSEHPPSGTAAAAAAEPGTAGRRRGGRHARGHARDQKQRCSGYVRQTRGRWIAPGKDSANNVGHSRSQRFDTCPDAQPAGIADCAIPGGRTAAVGCAATAARCYVAGRARVAGSTTSNQPRPRRRI